MMIGKCPHCGIILKEPPFNNRERNEVMIVLIYRKLIETTSNIDSIDKIGRCLVCNATTKDLKEQEQ